MYMNWMQMWQDCIREDGGHAALRTESIPGGRWPYWCGFIITGSWQTYLNYGDSRLIERYYPVMRHWLRYVDAYTVDGLLKRWPDTGLSGMVFRGLVGSGGCRLYGAVIGRSG